MATLRDRMAITREADMFHESDAGRARRMPTMILVIALSNLALSVHGLSPAPESRRDELVETLHGVPVADPYRWLEDRVAPEVQAWIDAQESRTRAALDGVAGRDALEKRLASLMRIDSLGTPVVRGGRYFYERRHADRDQFIVYVRDGLRGRERVLLDPHPWSEDHTTSVDLLDVSKDGTLAAYSVRTGGADEIEVRLIDVESGKDLPDRLPRARYWGVVLTGDKSGFYYARHDQKDGPRLLWHRLGTDSAQDRIVFGEGLAPDKGVSPILSHDDRWLMVMVWYGSAGKKTDVYVQDLASGGPFVPLVNDLDATFWGGIGDGHAYLQTDWNAPKGRIVTVDLSRPAREHWREVVPEREANIESFSLVGGRLCGYPIQGVCNVRCQTKHRRTVATSAFHFG